MIRAQEGAVPKEDLAFFRSRDPTKDRNRFWELLRHWYRDDSDRTWFADWDGFYFPGAEILHPAMDSTRVSFNGSTFVGEARFIKAALPMTGFVGATFMGKATFNETNFVGATFHSARFEGRAVFDGATFSVNTDFQTAEFSGDLSFRDAWCGQRPALFANAIIRGRAEFSRTTFDRAVTFAGVTFGQEVRFDRTIFGYLARFEGARMEGPCLFHQCTIKSELILDARLGANGSLQLIEAGAVPPESGDTPPTGPPLISLGAMSLERVELRSLDAKEVRLRGARDIEKLALIEVDWPRLGPSRNRVADEIDLDDKSVPAPPSPREVERIYRGLRKNFEDRSDRVGAHGWYIAEMEVGRLHARPFSLLRIARTLYRVTSDYGFSALRPLGWVLLVAALGLALFLVGGLGLCPATKTGPHSSACTSWGQSLEVVMLALFLQGPPDGIVLSGVLAQAVWILVRVVGAGMLLALAVAFRNQVAR